MENKYNNRDFEQFVKQNADQYRMFPSEKVWQGIDNALHTRRRWYGVGLALLLLLTGAGVTWVMISTPGGNKDVKTTVQGLPNDHKIADVAISTQQKPALPVKNINTPIVFSEDAVQTSRINTSFDDIVINNQPVEENYHDAVALLPAGGGMEETGIVVTLPIAKAAKTIPGSGSTAISKDITPFASPVNSITLTNIVQDKKSDKKAEVQDEKNQVPGDNYFLTIESVINSFQRPRLKKKVSLQIYFAPTVSYRKLSENKEFLRSAAATGTVPNYAAYNDVKNYVTHKPDIGLEMGVAAKYPLSKRLIVKAGLQFNVSRYDIRAFSSPSETATIALDATGSDSSFSRETTYHTRNNGNRANWLKNLYYSASIPIGAEFRLANKKKTYFGIGATIQPTYVISDRAYLISTDYKNYIEVPGSILRRFNLNTGFEFFVGYSSAKLHWQIGPQIRYQVRSTFQDKYPVKENLFDFGLKVGVMFKK